MWNDRTNDVRSAYGLTWNISYFHGKGDTGRCGEEQLIPFILLSQLTCVGSLKLHSLADIDCDILRTISVFNGEEITEESFPTG